MKKRYVLLLLATFIPTISFADSTINTQQALKEVNAIEVVFDSWAECKVQEDTLKGEILLKLAPEQKIDLNREYTRVGSARIGDTKKFVATYEPKLEQSVTELYSDEVRVIFSNWDACKKQGEVVNGKVLHTLNFAEKINQEANYYVIEAHRFAGTDKFIATYKLQY